MLSSFGLGWLLYSPLVNSSPPQLLSLSFPPFFSQQVPMIPLSAPPPREDPIVSIVNSRLPAHPPTVFFTLFFAGFPPLPAASDCRKIFLIWHLPPGEAVGPICPFYSPPTSNLFRSSFFPSAFLSPLPCACSFFLSGLVRTALTLRVFHSFGSLMKEVYFQLLRFS